MIQDAPLEFPELDARCNLRESEVTLDQFHDVHVHMPTQLLGPAQGGDVATEEDAFLNGAIPCCQVLSNPVADAMAHPATTHALHHLVHLIVHP